MDKNIMERLKKLIKNSAVIEENYDCVKCRDFGYIFERDEDRHEFAKPCE